MALPDRTTPPGSGPPNAFQKPQGLILSLADPHHAQLQEPKITVDESGITTLEYTNGCKQVYIPTFTAFGVYVGVNPLTNESPDADQAARFRYAVTASATGRRLLAENGLLDERSDSTTVFDEI